MQASEVTLGYWAVRGLAEPIRLLMEYTGLKYNQKKYTTGDDWQQDKAALGFDFPNVPYLLDGDKKVTESDAILQYVAIRSGHKELLGTTDDDKVKLATIRGVFLDARTEVGKAIYNPKFDEIFPGVLTASIFPKFANLDKFIGDKGVGLIGTGLTYIDFQFYESAQLLLCYDAKIFDNYPNLKRVIDTIENNANIQAYKASDRYQARPFGGQSAFFSPK